LNKHEELYLVGFYKPSPPDLLLPRMIEMGRLVPVNCGTESFEDFVCQCLFSCRAEKLVVK